ncbi:MAG: hypothetical protein ACTTIC_00215 [Helicobacteraceae bacterium]
MFKILFWLSRVFDGLLLCHCLHILQDLGGLDLAFVLAVVWLRSLVSISLETA